jgi:hypothetical protein
MTDAGVEVGVQAELVAYAVTILLLKLDFVLHPLAAAGAAAGPVIKQCPAGRDLSLRYGMDDTQSPDLPIFGRTAAHPSQQQQQGLSAAARDAASAQSTDADQMTPDAAANSQQNRQHTAAAAGTPVHAKAGGAAAAGGDDEDSTGQLYSSLIHCNMDGMSSRDVDMQEDQAEEPGALCTIVCVL